MVSPELHDLDVLSVVLELGLSVGVSQIVPGVETANSARDKLLANSQLEHSGIPYFGGSN